VSTATAGPVGAAPTGWPNRRVLVTLLILSAVLNFCFLAGVAWTRLHGRPGGRAWSSAFSDWRGTHPRARQRVGFDAYVAAMRTAPRRCMNRSAPLIGAAWEEIAKPQADAAQVMRLFDEAAEKRRDFSVKPPPRPRFPEGPIARAARQIVAHRPRAAAALDAPALRGQGRLPPG